MGNKTKKLNINSTGNIQEYTSPSGTKISEHINENGTFESIEFHENGDFEISMISNYLNKEEGEEK